MEKIAKRILGAFLPAFILYKIAFPSDIASLGYGLTNGKSKLNILGSFNENPIVYLNPGSEVIGIAGGFKFNVYDFEANPSLSYQKLQREENGKEESSSVVSNIELERRIKENISAFGQITSINESGRSEFSDKTTNIENLIDNTVPYNYTITTDVETSGSLESKTSALNYKIGTRIGENIEAYIGQNNISISTNLSGRVDTKVTLDGTIAGTDIYQITISTSQIVSQEKSNILETFIGGSYYFSIESLLTKVGAYQNIAAINAHASNSSFKAELKMIFPIGFNEEYFSGEDYRKTEKEINKYANNYVFNDAIDSIIDLKERGYSAIVTSIDTNGNFSAGYFNDKFRGKLSYKNKGDVSFSAGYNIFDGKITRTRDGNINYNINATFKLD